MKSLDFAAMENIQGGAIGGLPIGALLAIVTGLLNGVVALGVGALSSVEALLTSLVSSLDVAGGLGL
jgi:hypothetical protein